MRFFILIFSILLTVFYTGCSTNHESNPQKNAIAIEPIDVQPFIGLKEAEAQQLARSTGRQFRVVSRDGKNLVITQDRVVGRFNATVNNGYVTHIAIEDEHLLLSPDTNP